jgi:hypothetical protein
MIAAVLSVAAIVAATGSVVFVRRLLAARQRLERDLAAERREHGDTRDKLDRAETILRETEPIREAARVALDQARRMNEENARNISAVRQDNYLLRQLLSQAIRRPPPGSIEADRIEDQVRQSLRDRSPVPDDVVTTARTA